MRCQFFIKIGQVNITVIVTGNHDNGHACHLCTGRVCAMRGAWNQTNISRGITTAFMVTANSQQAGILTLTAGIGL